VLRIYGWARGHRSKLLRRELVAGVSLNACVIPERVSHTHLVRLWPRVGLYSSVAAARRSSSRTPSPRRSVQSPPPGSTGHLRARTRWRSRPRLAEQFRFALGGRAVVPPIAPRAC
jgi:hypothetical protein